MILLWLLYLYMTLENWGKTDRVLVLYKTDRVLYLVSKYRRNIILTKWSLLFKNAIFISHILHFNASASQFISKLLIFQQQIYIFQQKIWSSFHCNQLSSCLNFCIYNYFWTIFLAVKPNIYSRQIWVIWRGIMYGLSKQSPICPAKTTK